MRTNTNAALATAAHESLASLSDAELLTQTRHLVGRSNRLLAELLAHLGEVEARGIHRTRACSSLYTYLIYELRFSEDEAFRRVAAARLVRRFPALLDALTNGELHLTGLLMLGPHLTAENLLEVMARAKHRTKREIARLVRVLDPLPPVPSRIEPLGPAPARRATLQPTWEQFVSSLCPVRELTAGDRPREWGSEPEIGGSDGAVAGRAEEVDGDGEHMLHGDGADKCCERAAVTIDASGGSEGAGSTDSDGSPHGTAITVEGDGGFDPLPHAPARDGDEGCGDLIAPQHYKVQFTATEEYVRLVQEAKALLSHAQPRARLEELHLQAMRVLVEALRKRKYGAKTAARTTADKPTDDATTDDAMTGDAASGDGAPGDPATGDPAPGGPATGGPATGLARTHDATTDVARDGDATDPMKTRRRADANVSRPSPASLVVDAPEPSIPRQRGRHIPADTRRAVAARDGYRCTYVDASGTRCAETHLLEFHHVVPFALKPAHEISNLTLRCRAHNALAAEQDFGRDFVRQQTTAARHDPFREHGP